MYSGTLNIFFLVYLDANKETYQFKNKDGELVSRLMKQKLNRFHSFCKSLLTYAACRHTKNQPYF